MKAELSDLKFGLIPHDVWRERDGLEIFQKMITGELPQPPIAKTLGFRLEKIEAVAPNLLEHLKPIITIRSARRTAVISRLCSIRQWAARFNQHWRRAKARRVWNSKLILYARFSSEPELLEQLAKLSTPGNKLWPPKRNWLTRAENFTLTRRRPVLFSNYDLRKI